MTQQQKPRILIVEDDEAMALCLGGSLDQLGYEVLGTVTTGEEAISAVKEHLPDLVLMDVVLSGRMDGIAATEQIHLFSKVPVVYITGRTDIEQWQRAKITEPFGYILKPFELRELDVVIAAAFYKYRKEQEIFSIKNRFYSCLENLGGVVFHSDLDFKPFLVEGPLEQMTGYKPDQILSGKPRIEDMTHPEEGRLYSSEDLQKLKTVPDFAMVREHRVLTQDNQVLWVRESMKNVSNQNGHPVAIERVIYDITEYKKVQESCQGLQKQLLQSEKMASIGQLTVGVAHEINNPVGYISSNIEVLRQYVTGYTDVLKMAENLKKSVEAENMEQAKAIAQEMSKFEEEINLDYMINDVDKLLQHIEMGIEKIRKIVIGLRTFAHRDSNMMEPTDIEGVLESVISIVYNEIKYKAVINREFTKLPLVHCNPQEIGQVFINLLINAVQAISDKGEITIKTFIEGNRVGVAVSDTGSGILPKHMKEIFTPFFTTKEKGKGTGLGLSISYEIIKRHNGDILIESQPDKGTTFTVLLPIDVNA